MTEVDIQSKINEFLSSSLKKYMVREFDDAIRDLKAAEVIDPENPEIIFNLGINYTKKGLYKTAIEYFTKMLNMRFNFIDALEVKKIIAFSLIHILRYSEAMIYLEQVLELVPMDVVAISMKGYCYDIQGNYEKALDMYGSIIDLDKNNFNAYNSIAYILSKSGGDLKKALKFANIAHKSNKNNAAYLDTIGYIYMKMGEYILAEKYLQAALALSPFSFEIKNHLKEIGMMNV